MSIHCHFIRVMLVVTKRLRLESLIFAVKYHCTSAICVSSLMTKLKGIPSNFKHTFRLAASKVKLTSKFGFICSQISQLPRLVAQIYGNEQTCHKQKYMDDATLICRSACVRLTAAARSNKLCTVVTINQLARNVPPLSDVLTSCYIIFL